MKHSSDIRHKHEQLLVCIALELRISLQPLLPCLFDNLCARVGLSLVKRSYVVKVDLLPDQGLESWFCLVTMVVTVVMTVVFVIVARMIMPGMVRHASVIVDELATFLTGREFRSGLNSLSRRGFDWSISSSKIHQLYVVIKIF